MKLPTRRELEKAFTEAAEDAPLPLASCCDSSPLVRDFIEHLMRTFKLPEQAVKIGLVAGLNWGIRIGEKRNATRKDVLS